GDGAGGTVPYAGNAAFGRCHRNAGLAGVGERAMIFGLVRWAVHNRLVVSLLAIALLGVGGFALWKINIEAYPDPAPAIVEVIAQYPGASAEEVERQVTIPLEVAMAGMPGLQMTRSKSLFGLSHLRNQFNYG